VPRLIVNADDFGLTAGVNRAVLELHQAGLLTSSTLMVRAGASEQAIEIARANPTLGVGCHVVLVDGVPVLPASHVPSLISHSMGGFFPDLGPFLSRYFLHRIRPTEIEAEVTAQIRYLQAKGLRLTHIDSHKHVHMFPRVLRPILRAARACGIRTVRNPFEPLWAVRATTRAGLVRTAEVMILRAMQSTWRHIIEQEGFISTDGTIAVASTGVLDAADLQSFLEQIPEGTWELVTHPGYHDADLARVPSRLQESRDAERVALPVLDRFPAIERISFAALQPKA
jgi:hopanoid biosynthesis associated protein HpnK